MEEKHYQKTSGYLWQALLIIIGVLFIILSFALTQKADRVFATLNGLGVSLLLSGLLGFMIRVITYYKDAKYQVCDVWGIKNIYETRAIANLTINACQERARERVDIIAFGLSSWRNAKERLIDSMLAQGVEIRIITMDPDSTILEMRDKAENKTIGSTKDSIITLKKFFDQTEMRRKVKIKYHKELPLDFYFRVDDHVFVGPYLFGSESQQTITYEFEKGGEGYRYYTEYFEKLWKGKSLPSLEAK